MMAEPRLSLNFDLDLGYGDIVIEGREPSLEELLRLPIVAWLDRNVGRLRHPRDPQEMLNGDGWIIIADWNMLEYWNKPRCRVEITKSVSDRIVTEFWMRFQK
jgi:hypothetical protein